MKLTTHLETYIFEIEDFMTADECNAWMQWMDEQSYEQATITTQGEAIRREDIRNNDRIIDDNVERANFFWNKVRNLTPVEHSKMTAIGVNERFRYYRYSKGQKFDWHRDGCHDRNNGEKSLFTLLVYLNDDYEGGGTTFTSKNTPLIFDDLTIIPKKGKALLFYHPIIHRGDEVLKGMKYVARTDVMYSETT